MKHDESMVRPASPPGVLARAPGMQLAAPGAGRSSVRRARFGGVPPMFQVQGQSRTDKVGNERPRY